MDGIANREGRKSELCESPDSAFIKNTFAFGSDYSQNCFTWMVGLWESIRKAVLWAVEREDDVMIICEDDYYFTEHYNKSDLMTHITEAYQQGAQLLIRGVGRKIAARRDTVHVCHQLLVLLFTQAPKTA